MDGACAFDLVDAGCPCQILPAMAFDDLGDLSQIAAHPVQVGYVHFRDSIIFHGVPALSLFP